MGGQGVGSYGLVGGGEGVYAASSQGLAAGESIVRVYGFAVSGM